MFGALAYEEGLVALVLEHERDLRFLSVAGDEVRHVFVAAAKREGPREAEGERTVWGGGGVLEEFEDEHFDEDEGRVDCREDALYCVLEFFAAFRGFVLVSAVSLEDDTVGP